MAGGSRTFDYVVVGSGAGGGTVAARLAEASVSVLVLEAGADPAALKAEGLPQDYDVPAFHPFASENKAMAWNFMVHDFGDDAERRRRPEDDPPPGVLYPRASTLGGCTAHNAMILIAPQELGLERHRRPDRGPDMARRSHAALFPAHRGLPVSAALAASVPIDLRTSRSDRPRLARVAPGGKAIAAEGFLRPSADVRDPRRRPGRSPRRIKIGLRPRIEVGGTGF